MHSFSPLVMRYQHGSVLVRVGVYQRLHPVGHRIERVEYVEESRTRRQVEVLTEVVNAANRHEHTDRTAQGEKGTWVEGQLGVVDVRLSRTRRTHDVAHLFAQLAL